MWYRTHGNKVGWAGHRILIGLVMMLLGSWQQVATATHPPTPRPCEAEGVCRPSRTTWGWSQTRWRPWPGDQAGLQPSATTTPAAEQEQEGESFKAFERPTPEEEDQRGMPPKKADSDEPTAPVDESMPDLPAVELEGRVSPQPISVIDEVVLQLPAARDAQLRQSAEASHISHGVYGEPRLDSRLAAPHQPALVGVYEQASAGLPQPLPETEPEQPRVPVTENRNDAAAAMPADCQQDDLPPSLPASLRRVTMGLRNSTNTTTPRRQPRLNSGLARLPLPPAGGVLPATWQQPTAIRSSGNGLINPAAPISTGSDDDELKQAIYYETTE